MPIRDAEARRIYMREYEEERRLGLKRTGDVGEVLLGMDERREERAEYLRRWNAEHREARSRRKREQRRAAKLEREAAVLRRLG